LPNVLLPFGEARKRFDEIGGHTNLQLFVARGFRIEKMKIARLLVDDLARAGRRVDDREVGMVVTRANFFVAGS